LLWHGRLDLRHHWTGFSDTGRATDEFSGWDEESRERASRKGKGKREEKLDKGGRDEWRNWSIDQALTKFPHTLFKQSYTIISNNNRRIYIY